MSSLKRNPHVPPHFSGRSGKARVLAAIESQVLVGGDPSLARQIRLRGELLFFRKGGILLREGSVDNDILLILSGCTSILVGGRKVASRAAGTHVGEMALVDAGARRSATVVADEATVALRLSEPQFTALAAARPILWRRIAAVVASRLRERNASVRAPHTEPVVFIGSSTEGLRLAEHTHRSLQRIPLVTRLWARNVFEASRTTIESLAAIAAQVDFAVLVLTPDDTTVSRGRRRPAPRDNVIFELGLFIGAIGRERVFLLKPRGRDVKIPTDLLGNTFLEYAAAGPKPLATRLRSPLQAIRHVILQKGPI